MKPLLLSGLVFAMALVPTVASAWHAGEAVIGGYRLPVEHRFESPDASGTFAAVDINDVPSLIQQGRAVIDRTANVWIRSPEGTTNAQYLASRPAPAKPAPGQPAPAPAAGGPGDLVAGGYRLPRDHRYESPDASGKYHVVDVKDVPALIQQGRFIFDRTANVWVKSPNGTLNAKYVASKPAAAAAPGAATGAAGDLLAGGYRLPRAHRYESPDARGTYHVVDVKDVPVLIQQGRSIFDRTANVWVKNPNGTMNPAYVQPGR